MNVPATSEIFDVMHSCRAMRRLDTKDVSDETVLELLDAAIRAPSGGNAQNWRFVVVRDPDVKHALGEEVRKTITWMAAVNDERLRAGRATGAIPEEAEARDRRAFAAVNYLADHFDTTPVIICVCVEPDPTLNRAVRSRPAVKAAVAQYGVAGAARMGAAGSRLRERGMWASAYPAVQNILLAARAKGLGAVMTTPQILGPPGRVESVIGLPKNVRLAAVIAVGYPKGRFGPVRRRPVHEYVYRDHYGRAAPTAAATE